MTPAIRHNNLVFLGKIFDLCRKSGNTVAIAMNQYQRRACAICFIINFNAVYSGIFSNRLILPVRD